MTKQTEERAVGAPVAEWFGLLEKLVRSRRMYAAAHPTILQFEERLFEKSVEYLAQNGELTFSVKPFEFRFAGETVYRNDDKHENLTFRLHQDGIRRITMREGLERAELARLVRILLTDFTAFESCDDDMVTLLWKSEFAHLTYIAVETVAESGAGQSLDAEISRLVARHLQKTAPASLVPFAEKNRAQPRRLKKADVEELDRLPALKAEDFPPVTDELTEDARSQLAQDEERLIQRMLAVLFQVLEGRKSREDFEAVVQVILRVFHSVLHLHRLPLAARILQRLKEIASGGHPDASAIRAFATETLRNLNWDETLKEVESVFHAQSLAPADLAVFASDLPETAVPAFFRLFKRFDRPDVQEALLPAMFDLARGHLDSISAVLRSAPEELALKILAHFERLDPHTAAPHMRRAVQHAGPAVRARALEILGHASAAEGRALLIQGLEDGDRIVRLTALHGLLRNRTPDLAKPFLAVLETRGFGARDLDEKRAFFIGFGIVAGAGAVPWLKDQISPSLWKRSQEAEERQVAAAFGLQAVGTPAAQEIVRQAALSKTVSAELKTILADILRRWPVRSSDGGS